MIAMYIGIIGMSLSLTYALWIYVRVIRMQQDIYDIRDRLFDRATEFGSLEDPGYQKTREFLNSLIAAVPNISVPILLLSVLKGKAGSDQFEFNPTVKNPAMKKEIDLAFRQIAVRFVKYLAHETLSGIAVGILFLPLRKIGAEPAQIHATAQYPLKEEDAPASAVVKDVGSSIVDEATVTIMEEYIRSVPVPVFGECAYAT